MPVRDFDRGDLKDDLRNAGFENAIAEDIADRVENRKTDDWNADMARAEALKEIEVLINRTRQAYDNYRGRKAVSDISDIEASSSDVL